eukprot:COSAG02_NODE_530_length_20697_cov_20.103457_6_plen_675_part_00
MKVQMLLLMLLMMDGRAVVTADPCACIPCDRSSPEPGNDHCGPAWLHQGTSSGCGPTVGNPNLGCYTNCSAVCECRGGSIGTCSPPAPAPAPGSCALKPGAPASYKPVCEAEKTYVNCTKLSLTCVWVQPKPPPAPPAPCNGHGSEIGAPPRCSCDVGWAGANCTKELPCGVHPGYCKLKAGQPPQYEPLCANASFNKSQCDRLQMTCGWKMPSPAGRPCPLKFSPADLTGLWTGYGTQAKALFWAQTVTAGPPGSVCNDGGDGACYRIQCIVGNYSALPQNGANAMLIFGTGCPWASTTCTFDSSGPLDSSGSRNIVCNFGGRDGFDKEAAVSADGTVIGAAPNYPDSGLGLHRFTGAMTGLWAAVNDTVNRTTDIYLIGHDWVDNSISVYNFPATSDVVGAWQYATGSAIPTSTGALSTATVNLAFNSQSGIGTKHGLLNAEGNAITNGELDGGLGGWTKRTGMCDGAAGCSGRQRLPTNHLGGYRNVRYASTDCKGTSQARDFELTDSCLDYGIAGAKFGYNYSSGNLTVHVFDGSDCPCGDYTPVNPWSGGGGDCTCPASRCATKATHYLQYHALFGMNETTAPCAPVMHETVQGCGTGDTPSICKTQRWFPTPVEDKTACSLELDRLCSTEKAQGANACEACANIADHWNKLHVVGCTDSLLVGMCASF